MPLFLVEFSGPLMQSFDRIRELEVTHKVQSRVTRGILAPV